MSDLPDTELVAAAYELLAKYYLRGQHHLACLLRCGENIYPALHLNTSGFDICAEPIAIANAVMAGESHFDAIVAVSSDGNPDSKPFIVPPCGDCRHVLLQYAPHVQVILDLGDDIMLVPASDLLPYPYIKPSLRK